MNLSAFLSQYSLSNYMAFPKCHKCFLVFLECWYTLTKPCSHKDWMRGSEATKPTSQPCKQGLVQVDPPAPTMPPQVKVNEAETSREACMDFTSVSKADDCSNFKTHSFGMSCFHSNSLLIWYIKKTSTSYSGIA